MRPVIVSIRSYERPRQLLCLLRDLDRETPETRFTVRVFDDGSRVDMVEPQRFCEERGWQWVRFSENHGKRRAWEMFTRMFEQIRSAHVDELYFFLDDDMRLCRGFFKRANSAWGSIPDGHKATLHLMVDASRQNQSCWTSYAPTKINDGIRRIQWVDGCFMCERNFFTLLEWKVLPIATKRWKTDPTISTGVGRQMSQRLLKRNWNMYQVVQSLIAHVHAVSRMNPEARRGHPLTTVNFVDGPKALRDLIDSQNESSATRARRQHVMSHEVLARERTEASLASIPSRQAQLKEVVQSLLNQVDVLRVYLNGYEHVPAFLDRERIVVATSQEYGDLGDRGKFFWCEQAKGVQIVCDDDLLYAPSYVGKMLHALGRFGATAAIGLHGVTLCEPMLSYYHDRSVVHFGNETQEDHLVHLLGTGCLAYHADQVQVKQRDFELPNMADVWFGLICQRQKVSMVAVRHDRHWVKPLPTGESIYDEHKHDDAEQTEAVRSMWPWDIFRPSKI